MQATDSQLRPVGDGELTWAECHGQAAIVIEPVSAENLCKTGISADRAGDFRQFRFQYQEIGSLETVSNARKAGISGRVSRRLQTVAKRTTGWRRSADRAGLHAISLLTGNFTGNLPFLRC